MPEHQGQRQEGAQLGLSRKESTWASRGRVPVSKSRRGASGQSRKGYNQVRAEGGSTQV